MDIQKFFQSGEFKWILKGLGGLIILLAVFQLGLFVGFRKANFSYRWGDNYHKAFGGPRGGFMGGPMMDFWGRDFTSGHGVAGKVIKVEGDSIVVRGSDNVEKIINISSGTVIEQNRQAVKLAGLKIDSQVVIIGTPKDDGSIDAKMIRVFGLSNNQPQAQPQSFLDLPPAVTK